MQIVVIAHNIRSVLNVGSIFRTCEGFGVRKLWLTGYTPYPEIVGGDGASDSRLPHLRARAMEAIAKTALGAEKMVPFGHREEVAGLLEELKAEGFTVVGLEQDARSVELSGVRERLLGGSVAILLGEEVAGIAPELREQCDILAEIPMFGCKESFNVAVAAGVALYEMRR